MENITYIESLINSSDKIYMDTSTLMNVPELIIFLDRTYEKLLNSQKSITIHNAVFMELTFHSISGDERKRELALQVLEILSEYKDIFSLNSEETTSDTSMKNFADTKLLAELTENKVSYRQLFITNDRKLSFDAFELNNLESCKGYKIKVCYVNKYGELHRCSCVSKNIEPEIKVIEKEVIKYVHQDNNTSNKTRQVVIPIATFFLGCLASKKNVITYIKNVLRRNNYGKNIVK